jgi:hypothetical protein
MNLAGKLRGRPQFFFRGRRAHVLPALDPPFLSYISMVPTSKVFCQFPGGCPPCAGLAQVYERHGKLIHALGQSASTV